MNARSKDKRLIYLSTPAQLRQVVQAFSKIDPDHRQAAARWIVNQAVELSAVHMVGRSVVEAANIAPDSDLGQRVIELAGRWKHGYIPLDAVALRAKMKGGHGKPWWTGGKTKTRGNKASLRKSIEAGKKARGGKVTFHEPVTGRTSKTPIHADPSQSVGRARLQARTGRMQHGQVDPGQGHRVSDQPSAKRTTVVKSGAKSNATRGATVETFNAAEERRKLAEQFPKGKVTESERRIYERALDAINAKEAKMSASKKSGLPEPRTYLRTGHGSGPSNQVARPGAKATKRAEQDAKDHAAIRFGGKSNEQLENERALAQARRDKATVEAIKAELARRGYKRPKTHRRTGGTGKAVLGRSGE